LGGAPVWRSLRHAGIGEARRRRHDLAYAWGPGEGRLADARKSRDRPGVVLAGPRPDARALADGMGARVVACLKADARAFGHGPVAALADALGPMACQPGDGSGIEQTGVQAMAGIFRDLTGVRGASAAPVAASARHSARVTQTGVRTVAGALAHVALIVPARERALAAVLGYVSGIVETGGSLDARAHAHVALVLSTHVLAVRRRGPNAGVLVDVAGIVEAGAVTDARAGLQSPGVARAGVGADTGACRKSGVRD